MNAAAIAAVLGDARREGRAWRCLCPLHGGHSLVIKDGDGGRVLATCFGGCNRLEVLAELRRRGLLDRHSDYAAPFIAAPRRDDDTARTARALSFWSNTQRGAGTIVAQYLGGRGIALDLWPASLRFHPRCPRPKDDTDNFVPPLPAMVGLVEHVERGPVAAHCTYLRPDGTGKAAIEEPKAIFGPVAGGAVRFGPPREGEWLAIAEGIETTLSVMRASGLVGWAALSEGGIRKLVLPPEATHVLICSDHDASGVGERAGREAAQRFLAEGRLVRLAMPPMPNSDWNDVLLGKAPARVRKALSDVA